MTRKQILFKIRATLLALIPLYQKLIDILISVRPMSQEEVRKIITQISKEEDVNKHLAMRVAMCESGLDPEARNLIQGKGIDRGLYQWNSYYHPEISDRCAYDIECSTKEFCKAVRAGKLWWWNPSRACWDKSYKYSQ